MPDPPAALELHDVEKQYGALRPLRVRNLNIQPRTSTTLIGLDLPAAETFVNLITGAVLPDKGEVVTLGRHTSAIVDSDDWLKFVEQFGFVSDRIALLDAMTAEQNLAIPFSLEIDPIPAEVLSRVHALAAEVGIAPSDLGLRVGEASPMLRARVRLARALALDPLVLVLEHPTAALAPEDATPLAALIAGICRQRSAVTMVAAGHRRVQRTKRVVLGLVDHAARQARPARHSLTRCSGRIRIGIRVNHDGRTVRVKQRQRPTEVETRGVGRQVRRASRISVDGRQVAAVERMIQVRVHVARRTWIEMAAG
jgi:ABC-type transporter Mla maintaining outer membrane lipid asymmetry ATPase subunit MlaF